MKTYLFVFLALFSLVSVAEKPALGTIWLADPEAPQYGDEITLGVELQKTIPESETYTSVRCFQGEDLRTTVYVDKYDPEHKYLLLREESPSRNWDGGPAECAAALVYCPTKGKDWGTCGRLDAIQFSVLGE